MIEQSEEELGRGGQLLVPGLHLVRTDFKGGTHLSAGFPGGSDGKESACNAGDPVRSPGPEDPLEEGMATHSSILAWRIPWTEVPAGYGPQGGKESDTTEVTQRTRLHLSDLQYTHYKKWELKKKNLPSGGH